MLKASEGFYGPVFVPQAFILVLRMRLRKATMNSHPAQALSRTHMERGAAKPSREGHERDSMTTRSQLGPSQPHWPEPEEDKTPEEHCCSVWANSSSGWQHSSISAPSPHLLSAHVCSEREIIAAHKTVQEMLNASIF